MDHDPSFYARQMTPHFAHSQAPKRTHSGSIRNHQNIPHHAVAQHAPQVKVEPGIPKPPAAPTQFLPGTPITSDILDHIDGLKHLDDRSILELLKFARYYGTGNRASILSTATSLSTGSSSSMRSSVPSLYSDHRSSIASTLSSYSLLDQNSTRAASVRGTPNLSASRSPANQTPKNSQPHTHFCTFCQKGLTSKTYWKHHEEEHHEQAKKWMCPDCDRCFYAEKRFLTHHVKDHGCRQCAKSKICPNKAETIVHRKVAWGCGFCVKVLDSWENRCDHIAKHFEEEKKSISEWRFSTVILSLLEQPAIAEAWESFVSERHPDERPTLSWEKREASILRKKLEQYGSMQQHLSELVQQTYELAHQTAPPPDQSVVSEELASPQALGIVPAIETIDIDPQSAIATEECTPNVYTPDPHMDVTGHMDGTSHMGGSTHMDGSTHMGGAAHMDGSAFAQTLDQAFAPTFFIEGLTHAQHDPSLLSYTQPGDYMSYMTAGQQDYRTSINRSLSTSTLRRVSPARMSLPIDAESQNKPLPPDPPAAAHRETMGLINSAIRVRSPHAQSAMIPEGWRDDNMFMSN